jgi:Protein of unknown function (DUF3616)
LVSDPALAPFDLGKAATLAPKDEGALNIEALAADGDKLWIGFRNPKNKAKEALLVPLLNPMEAIKEGARAKLGDPVTLKLGGLGVRDMVAWSGGFLIIDGDFGDRFEQGAKPSRGFLWKPGTDPHDIGVDFGDLNPEAIVIMRQGDKAATSERTDWRWEWKLSGMEHARLGNRAGRRQRSEVSSNYGSSSRFATRVTDVCSFAVTSPEWSEWDERHGR